MAQRRWGATGNRCSYNTMLSEPVGKEMEESMGSWSIARNRGVEAVINAMGPPSQQTNEADIKKAVAEAIAEQLKPKPPTVEEISTEAMQPASQSSTAANEPQIVTMLSKIDSKQDRMDGRIDAFQQLWDDRYDQ